MMRVSFFITLSCVGLLLGCGKGTDQAKEVQPKAQPKTEVKKQSEPSPPNNPPANPTAPKDNAKTPQPVKNADENQTAQFASDKSFLQSLRPLHEGKPSTLKIELEKLRAKGEPVTLEELDTWQKATPPGNNAAVAYLQTTNSLPENSHELWVEIAKERRRLRNNEPTFTMAPSMRPKVQALLSAHQAHINQLHAIYQKYPINQPARFPVDWTRGFNTPFPHLAKVKRSCNLFEWRSRYFAETGDTDQAVLSILVMLRLCHLIDGEPIPISTLMHFSCLGMGNSATEKILNLRMLNDAQLTSLQKAFSSFQLHKHLAAGYIGERALILGAEQVARTGSKEEMERAGLGQIDKPGSAFMLALRYRPETMRDVEMTTFLGYMNAGIEALKTGYPKLTKFHDTKNEFWSKWDRFFALAGKQQHKLKYPLILIVTPALNRTGRRLHETTFKQQATLAALAIERYRLANQGRIPKTLAQLTPKYLATEPFDPYTGGPLNYLPGPNGEYELHAAKAEDPEVKNSSNRLARYVFKVNPANRLK